METRIISVSCLCLKCATYDNILAKIYITVSSDNDMNKNVKVLGNRFGPMEPITKVNGLMIKSMAMDYESISETAIT